MSPLDARTIKLLLETADMSQAELSRRSGVSARTITRIATGKAGFTRDTMEKLADGLSLPIDAFAKTRDFLLDLDHLRGLQSGPGASDRTESTRAQTGAAPAVSEDVRREREQYLEDWRIVDSATKALRDLAMHFMARGHGSSSGSP